MLQAVCDHLRQVADLDSSPAIAPADLAHITALTEAAVSMVETKCRRALLTQSWTATFDGFCPALHLLLPPVQSVTSVKYLDAAGDQQTLAGAAYRLIDPASWDPRIVPASGTSWPATADYLNAVEVEFVTGYGDDAEDVPAPIRQAILMTVAHWYTNREATITGTIVAVLPIGVAELIQPYRIYR
jgi:uncharacterized phiE125 gp8 family phage protein